MWDDNNSDPIQDIIDTVKELENSTGFNEPPKCPQDNCDNYMYFFCPDGDYGYCCSECWMERYE